MTDGKVYSHGFVSFGRLSNSHFALPQLELEPEADHNRRARLLLRIENGDRETLPGVITNNSIYPPG